MIEVLFMKEFRMKMGSEMKAARAFTLIELLTVIAIIGILAAILIPVVSAARHSANQAKNVVQLRNLGMACHTYAIDHDGRLPVVVHHPGPGSVRMTQGIRLWPHQAQNSLSLLSDKWVGSGSVWSRSDYLDDGPDAFYGPFTPDLNARRGKNGFVEHGTGFEIGYVQYSLPSAEDWSGRPILAPGLHNDYNDRDYYLNSTPLFSDITADSWVELLGGFTGNNLSVVRLDGSVRTFSREFLGRVGSNDRIRIIGGVMEKP